MSDRQLGPLGCPSHAILKFRSMSCTFSLLPPCRILMCHLDISHLSYHELWRAPVICSKPHVARLHVQIAPTKIQKHKRTLQTSIKMLTQSVRVTAVALLCLCHGLWHPALAKRATTYSAKARSTNLWDSLVHSTNTTSYGVPAVQVLTRSTSADHFSKVAASSLPRRP